MLRRHFFGLESEEVAQACRALAEMCNLLAMSFLQQDNFPVTIDLLKKAEVLTQQHGDRFAAERATTLNNLACYYRRLGKLHAAMTSLRSAVTIEKRLGRVENAADTLLNLCAVLSQLGKHDQALVHAQEALVTLQEDIFRPENKASPSLDRVSVMCIAYHNVGVEQEFLRVYDESVQSYKKGVGLAEQYLGPEHSVTITIRNSYLAAKRSLSAKPRSNRQRESDPYAASPSKGARRLLSSPRSQPGNPGSPMPSPLSKEKQKLNMSAIPTPRSIIADALSRKSLPPLESPDTREETTKKKKKVEPVRYRFPVDDDDDDAKAVPPCNEKAKKSRGKSASRKRSSSKPAAQEETHENATPTDACIDMNCDESRGEALPDTYPGLVPPDSVSSFISEEKQQIVKGDAAGDEPENPNANEHLMNRETEISCTDGRKLSEGELANEGSGQENVTATMKTPESLEAQLEEQTQNDEASVTEIADDSVFTDAKIESSENCSPDAVTFDDTVVLNNSPAEILDTDNQLNPFIDDATVNEEVHTDTVETEGKISDEHFEVNDVAHDDYIGTVEEMPDTTVFEDQDGVVDEIFVHELPSDELPNPVDAAAESSAQEYSQSSSAEDTEHFTPVLDSAADSGENGLANEWSMSDTSQEYHLTLPDDCSNGGAVAVGGDVDSFAFNDDHTTYVAEQHLQEVAPEDFSGQGVDKQSSGELDEINNLGSVELETNATEDFDAAEPSYTDDNRYLPDARQPYDESYYAANEEIVDGDQVPFVDQNFDPVDHTAEPLLEPENYDSNIAIGEEQQAAFESSSEQSHDGAEYIEEAAVENAGIPEESATNVVATSGASEDLSN